MEVLPGGEGHHPPSPLLLADIGHLHFHVPVQALLEAELHLVPDLEALDVLAAHQGHEGPLVAVDHLAHAGGGAGDDVPVAGGGQLLDALRGQHGLVAVRQAGEQAGAGGGHPLSPGSAGGGQLADPAPEGLDGGVQPVGAGVGVAPAEHGGAKGLPHVGGGLHAALRHSGPEVPQGPGDLLVQPGGGLAAVGQGAGVLQLLQLVRQVPEDVGVAQCLGGGIDHSHRAAPAHPLALLPGGIDQLAAAGQYLLLPHHVAGDGHRVLAGVGVGHGGGVGVGKVGRQIHAEVGQQGQEHGGYHQFCR